MSNRKLHALHRAPILVICVALASIAALQGGCSKDTGRNASSTSQDQPKKLSIGDLETGTSLGPHGGIAQGAEKSVFTASETIHVSMRLRNAPKGTTVKVVWKSPAGEALGEETKSLRPGQDYMHFSADGANLPPGAGYHAEISANGQPITVLKFDLASSG